MPPRSLSNINASPDFPIMRHESSEMHFGDTTVIRSLFPLDCRIASMRPPQSTSFTRSRITSLTRRPEPYATASKRRCFGFFGWAMRRSISSRDRTTGKRAGRRTAGISICMELRTTCLYKNFMAFACKLTVCAAAPFSISRAINGRIAASPRAIQSSPEH